MIFREKKAYNFNPDIDKVMDYTLKFNEIETFTKSPQTLEKVLKRLSIKVYIY